MKASMSVAQRRIPATHVTSWIRCSAGTMEELKVFRFLRRPRPRCWTPSPRSSESADYYRQLQRRRALLGTQQTRQGVVQTGSKPRRAWWEGRQQAMQGKDAGGGGGTRRPASPASRWWGSRSAAWLCLWQQSVDVTMNDALRLRGVGPSVCLLSSCVTTGGQLLWALAISWLQ